MVPVKLKGSEFEGLLLDAAEREERAGRLTMSRYGVQSVNLGGGKVVTVPSLPDFDGVLAFPAGRQFVIEAKVVSGSRLQMDKTFIKPRQVSHMLTRSRFGVLCYLVIHFNARTLVKSNEPGMTIAIPVTGEDPRWQEFVDAYAAAKRDKVDVSPRGSISRDEAFSIGKLIHWRVPKGCRKPLPDILSLLDPQCLLKAADETPTLL